MVVQEKDFKELDEGDKAFQTFGKLSVSQKIALIDIKEFDDKKDFLKINPDIECLSVRAFKKKLSEFCGDSIEFDPGILTLIKKPELLLLEESQEKFELNKLKKKPLKYLQKYYDKLLEKKQKLETELEDFQKKTKDYKQYFEKFDEVKENIDEALKIVKAKNKRKGKTKKVKKS